MLGSDAPRLVEALDGTPSVSVRYNPFKHLCQPSGTQPESEGAGPLPPLPGDGTAEPITMERVPWCPEGRYLSRRPYFTADPSFQAGRYYVQEASSMFVSHLYRSAVGEHAHVRLLDLCAAPGGKTTLYSSLVGPEGLVVANEVVHKRALVLADNVMRWGVGNVAVTGNDPSHFASLPSWFDVVAVDAPCSGEGMFRKDPTARSEWSADNVIMCAARQRRILEDVWDALRPGGVLIYSTCTFNRTENEENVAWLADNFPCEAVDVDTPPQWGITRTFVHGINCFRFFPHLTRGEGFFATVLRKGSSGASPRMPKPRKNPFAELPKQHSAELKRWVAGSADMVFRQVGDNAYGYRAATFGDVKCVCEQLSVLHSGICMGQFFGRTLRPDHSLALFCDVSRELSSAVSLPVAQSFLTRGTLPCDPFREGISLLSFNGLPIGWVKRVGGRVNSLLPKQFAVNSLRP